MSTASGVTITVNQDGIANNAPANTVELQSGATTTNSGTCGGANRFCGTVTLRSFFGGDILVQPSAEIQTVSPATGHNPINTLGALRAIDIAHGASLTPGIFDYTNTNPNASTPRLWVFENLNAQPFTFKGRMYADLQPLNNADYIFEATVNNADNDWIAIHARVGNNGADGYRFRIGNDSTNGRGCRLERISNNAVTLLTGRPLSTIANPNNCFFPSAAANPAGVVMALRVDGNQITPFLNGLAVTPAFTDSTFPAGDIALGTWGNGDPPHPPFDNGVRFFDVSVRRVINNSVIFADTFTRADGAVGNGWTVNDHCSLQSGTFPPGCQRGGGTPQSSNWRISTNRVIEDTNIFSSPLPPFNNTLTVNNLGYGSLLLHGL